MGIVCQIAVPTRVYNSCKLWIEMLGIHTCDTLYSDEIISSFSIEYQYEPLSYVGIII